MKRIILKQIKIHFETNKTKEVDKMKIDERDCIRNLLKKLKKLKKKKNFCFLAISLNCKIWKQILKNFYILTLKFMNYNVSHEFEALLLDFDKISFNNW